MLPERNNLSSVGGVHFIKGASYALVNHPCNMRRVGNPRFAVNDNIKQPICDFNFWGHGKQPNHRIHFLVFLVGRSAIVINCGLAQHNFTTRMLKKHTFFAAMVKSPAFLRGAA